MSNSFTDVVKSQGALILETQALLKKLADSMFEAQNAYIRDMANLAKELKEVSKHE